MCVLGVNKLHEFFNAQGGVAGMGTGAEDMVASAHAMSIGVGEVIGPMLGGYVVELLPKSPVSPRTFAAYTKSPGLYIISYNVFCVVCVFCIPFILGTSLLVYPSVQVGGSTSRGGLHMRKVKGHTGLFSQPTHLLRCLPFQFLSREGSRGPQDVVDFSCRIRLLLEE